MSRGILVAVLALVVIAGGAGYFVLKPSTRALEPVTPQNEGTLNPQLQQYLPRFIEAVRASPSDYRRHGELGLVYESNEYWHEAAASFANAVTLAPDEPLPRLHLAISQGKLGQTDRAVTTLLELTTQNPDFAPGQHRLGRMSLETGDLTRAEQAFERVIALQPDSHEGYVGLADVKIQQREFAGAQELLEKALAMKPDDGTAHHLLGLAYLGLGREQDAQRAMARGAETQSLLMTDEWTLRLPAHTTSLPRQVARAQAFASAGRLEEAANVYLTCLRYYPDNPDLLCNLAVVRSQQGRPDDMLSLLREALEANPRHHQSYSNLASYFHDRNDTEQAVILMAKAVEFAPNDAGYRRKIAFLQTQLGQYAEAREHLIVATAHEPGNARNFAKLAEACARLGLHDEARQAIGRARQVNPNDPSIAPATNLISSLDPQR